MHQRRNMSSFLGGSKPHLMVISIGVAAFGIGYLYRTVYGSYNVRKVIETKDEIVELGGKAKEIYDTGVVQDKFENWKNKRETKKLEKKEKRKEKRKEERAERVQRLKENIDEGIHIYKDTKKKLQSDK